MPVAQLDFISGYYLSEWGDGKVGSVVIGSGQRGSRRRRRRRRRMTATTTRLSRRGAAADKRDCN